MANIPCLGSRTINLARPETRPAQCYSLLDRIPPSNLTVQSFLLLFCKQTEDLAGQAAFFYAVVGFIQPAADPVGIPLHTLM
jgi:hypothetical protein